MQWGSYEKTDAERFLLARYYRVTLSVQIKGRRKNRVGTLV